MNKYDLPFAKLTAEQSKELARKMDGGMGMGKRPPQKKEAAKSKTAKSSGKKK